MDGMMPAILPEWSDPRLNELTRSTIRNDSAEVESSNGSAKGAAKDFEGVFLSLLLKSMRQTLSEDGFFGSEASDTFGGMFDLYMGQHLAASKMLGVGTLMESYLENRGPQDAQQP